MIIGNSYPHSRQRTEHIMEKKSIIIKENIHALGSLTGNTDKHGASLFPSQPQEPMQDLSHS